MTFEQFEKIETSEDDQLIAMVATHFGLNPLNIHWNGEGLELIKYYKALKDYGNKMEEELQRLIREQQQELYKAQQVN